jgi:hypothetical protein
VYWRPSIRINKAATIQKPPAVIDRAVAILTKDALGVLENEHVNDKPDDNRSRNSNGHYPIGTAVPARERAVLFAGRAEPAGRTGYSGSPVAAADCGRFPHLARLAGRYDGTCT